MIGLAILCAVIVVVYVLNTILPVDWVWLSTEQMADAVIVVVYVLNTILPVDWVWLSTEQMADIRSLAISILIGVIASLINNYFWRK